jgi:threonine/homoserine/homoserine lactone efflux protein
MLDLRTFILFLVAASAAIAAPGPDILYVLSRAISAGRRTGCISAVAIASGEVLHTLLAVVGLATLLQASAKAFLVVKLAGAFYLVYLGIKLMCKPNPFAAVQRLARAQDWPVFRQGVLTNLFNPKAILFFVTFLPQFVNPRSEHAQFQLALLGLTFAFIDVVFLGVLALAAGRVNTWLTRKPENARRVSVISGSLLVGLGLRLALAERD